LREEPIEFGVDLSLGAARSSQRLALLLAHVTPRRSASAISSEASRDQRSAVLRLMTRTGLEYCPSSKSRMTVSRSVLSGLSRATPGRGGRGHQLRKAHPDRRRAARWKVRYSYTRNSAPKPPGMKDRAASKRMRIRLALHRYVYAAGSPKCRTSSRHSAHAGRGLGE